MTAEQSIRNIERLMDAVNAATQVEPDPRADLVDLFEAHAETHDDKSWIEVEEAVDLVMDRDAETVSLNELMSAIWGVSTQDFGGYSSRDALAVAHALEDRFTITAKRVHS